MLHETLTLIEPITSKEIARAIKRYFRLYRRIPRYIKIIDRTKTTTTDVYKLLRQIKEEKERLNNGRGLLHEYWSTYNNLNVRQHQKYR